MLKFTKAIAVVGVCALGAPAMAASVFIDFEEFAGGDTITAGTDVGGGLTFDRNLRIDATGLLSGPPATSGNVAFAPNATFAQGDDVMGYFSSVVSSLRLGAGDLGFDPDTVILTAFDVDMNVVGTDRFTGRAAEFLEVAGAGITSFFLEFDDVRLPAGTGSGGFDNITFEVAAVPLPASLPFLLAGLLGFGIVRQRNDNR
ncbi:VPLPA-CTERM sorting domain-containing protein [Rhodobacteraceae bacterium]|nr:VPLPA-CTERM sorting domain-containing protein [Paracoccaceae bacterium]